MTSKKTAAPAIVSTHVIGCDDGHDSIKICSGYSPETKTYICTHISSRAAQGIHQVTSLGDAQSISAYDTAGAAYTVTGDQALSKAMDTRGLDYPVSDLNRVLVAHALVKAGFSGKLVSIVTGLPVDQYYKDGLRNTALIEKKTESLLKPVKTIGKGLPTAEIATHRCVSEGIGAFYDALIDEKGSVNLELEKLISRRPIGIVDLGGKTMDQAVIMEGAAGIYNARSGSSNVGVLALYDQVTAQIKSKFDLNNDPPLSYIAEAFRTKTYELFGEANDVRELIETCCRQYVSSVKTEFMKKAGIGDGSDLGAVIFVGGGTALLHSIFGESIFKDIFKGKTIIPEQPEFANARGMWKNAAFIQTKQESEANPAPAEA